MMLFFRKFDDGEMPNKGNKSVWPIIDVTNHHQDPYLGRLTTCQLHGYVMGC